MNKVCLFGASGHGKVIKEVVLSNKKKVVAFFDDNPKSKTLLDTPVFSSERISDYLNNRFIISIGDNTIRKKISKIVNMKFTMSIHKSAIISNSVIINEGTVVMAGAIINAETIIGRHCVINTSAIVEHDCKIDSFVHISPNATITGNVEIGEGTHIGAGAIIIPNTIIGKWVTIGAGAVVLNDIPDFAIVVGNPAKIIKYKNK